MQHQKKNRTFGRKRKVRTALMRSLAINLIERGKIQTTEAKAKELRSYVERLITYGKKDTLAARRTAATKLGQPKSLIIKRLFEEVAPKYKERNGGYTRVIKVGHTEAGREEAVIEFV